MRPIRAHAHEAGHHPVLFVVQRKAERTEELVLRHRHLPKRVLPPCFVDIDDKSRAPAHNLGLFDIPYLLACLLKKRL